MNQKTLGEKIQGWILKVKQNPIRALFAIIFLICFLIFSYTHPLNAPYNKNVRTTLPEVILPTGTFSLITEPDQGITPVLDLINNSTHSIDLVMYEFKDRKVADALISAEKRGVAVRVLVNGGYYDKKEKTNDSAYVYLASQGIPVHFTPSYFALTHQKTLVVDNDKALIMTFNFVPNYYSTARDFAILDTNQNDVTAIENTFGNDWSNKNILATNGDDLVWSPGSEEDMLLIINSAKSELDIYNEEMADASIASALVDAVKRGVNVNIIMTYQSLYKNVFGELKNAGASLHLFHGQKFYIHAKMILADRKNAFLGSENFSFGSLSQNRELGIFLSDPTITSSLFKTFSTDWQNATPY